MVRSGAPAGSADLGGLPQGGTCEHSSVLGAALRRVLERMPEGGRALAVGHCPTNEAAVLGLTGATIEPISAGAGVLVVSGGDQVRVEPVSRLAPGSSVAVRDARPTERKGSVRAARPLCSQIPHPVPPRFPRTSDGSAGAVPRSLVTLAVYARRIRLIASSRSG